MFWEFSKRFLLVASVIFYPGAVLAASASQDQTTETRRAERYRSLPLSFELNRGQTDSQARFLARGSGYALLLAPTKIMLVMNRSRQANPEDTTAADKPFEPAVLELLLVGSRSGDAAPRPGAAPREKPLPYRESIRGMADRRTSFCSGQISERLPRSRSRRLREPRELRVRFRYCPRN